MINIQLPDGSKKEFEKGITTLDVAKSIGAKLAKDSVAAQVNDKLVDLSYKIETDCELKIITKNSKEGLDVLRHSSSHVMAEAVLELFPDAKLGIGPAIEEGFYYDFGVKKPFEPADLEGIEKKVIEIIKRNETFERKELKKKEAIQLLKDNPYKKELIEELPDEIISIYSNGKFTDLCRGPHIPNTLLIGGFKILKSSSAYWKGNEKNATMQRIYGISFFEKKDLEDWINLREEAAKRDHVKLGKELDLFSLHPEAPGFVFMHPKGMVIWNELMNFWHDLHFKAEYDLINTPLIMKKHLWVTSGHWDHYKENMYFTKIDDEDYAIKPMNCPGGILVYKEKRHSYKELPLRLGELGTVHRHERSGVLHGLFRVRKFTQDDAHIFCTEEQIENEISKIIELADSVYKTVGFKEYHVELSTRPENSMGSDVIWERATNALENALKKKNMKYKINAGDGAFYGPKIDFHIKDALGRTWQCATIQVDFSMPERFDLYYIGEDDKKHRPVMLHRVLFGSVERFLGILIEHYAGKFPLWLSPVQTRIITVSDEFNNEAEKICQKLREHKIRAEFDNRKESIGRKVRDAELEKIPYIITIGKKEIESGKLAVRSRDQKITLLDLEEFVKNLEKEIEEKK
ncbi:MAG: threonine--tRNA ligase [Candidatus Diapherotrites archaeon CG08_land_8_20_14_0_20_34_12]|nr:MAG: threonine--tRNA ligase [Candidatus Diapherotrites archaeon CG08_land_8_20_14_0_20_34_12]